VPAWKQMQSAFAKEVERLGKIWVGETGKLEVKVLSKRVLHLGVWTTTLNWKYMFAKTKV
jgi:hypothetical protein